MNSVFTTPAPSFTLKEIKKILESKFGISGSLKHLYGDRDQNFYINTNRGSFILKVFNTQEEKKIIDLQDRAVTHIKKNYSSAAVPSSVDHKEITINGEIYHFKIQEFLEGDFLHKAEMSINDYSGMGKFIGNLSKALTGFDHKAAHRVFDWDCSQTSIIKRNLSFVQNRKKRKTILYFVNKYEETVTPYLKELRMSVIHNDANHHNILKNRIQKCYGIIDFGDMVFSYQVIEPAVAIAYIYLSSNDPLGRIFSFLRGYNSSFTLEPIELKVITYFMCMRICSTATMSAWRKKLFPKNKYLTISEKPAWSALEKLSKVNLNNLSLDILKNVKKN